MPMRDSRPRDSAPGSSPIVNRAGSRDSMISVHSGHSVNSMEHLSAEERACLTFLEETIESLEAEDDNGISVDGPHKKMMNKMPQLSSVSPVSPQGLSSHDDPNKTLKKDHKSNKLLVPTPLVLANGNAKLLKKKDSPPTGQKPPSLVNNPKTAALNPYQSSAFLTPADAYSSSEGIESPPAFIPEPPVRHNTLPIVLLPPPSDFMDEPMLSPPVRFFPGGQKNPQTSTRLSSQSDIQYQSQPTVPPSGLDGHVGTNNSLTLMSTSPRAQLSSSDLDKLRKKALTKKAPEMVPVFPVKSGHNVSPQTNSPTFDPGSSAVADVEYEELKSPPSVAPKPKKLPSSIVLKTHKDAPSGHSLVSPGDRMIINQQKVHLEALKKLGLLKTAEIDSGLCLSPQSKTSPHSPSNILPHVASLTECTTSPTRVSPKQHESVKAQDEADFSYLSVQPEKEGRENALVPTRTPSLKPFEMKSVSMERSGVGMKSPMLKNASRLTRPEESLENPPVSFGHLRNSRSQPACEESSKGIGTKQIPSESNKQPELRRSLPDPVPSQPKTESQKAVRSQGISVIISPQDTDSEDRRQALRRLGLGLINDQP